MTRPGPKRQAKGLPHGIQAQQLPTGVYWCRNGRGHWYTISHDDQGKRHTHRLAGPEATLAELHQLRHQGKIGDSFDWLAQQYLASPDFKRLAPKTQTNYAGYLHRTVSQHPSKFGKVGALPLSDWTPGMVQILIDRIGVERGPSAAHGVLAYINTVFAWNRRRDHVKDNPATGIKAPPERKRRTLPSDQAYQKILDYSQHAGPSYLHSALQLLYLCRMRGIELFDLTDANEHPEGLLINRRKGSRSNIVAWSPSLRQAWDSLKARRDALLRKHRIPTPLKPEDRHLMLSDYRGGKMSKENFDRAWARFINAAIAEGIITEEERFSPHSLKRKGVTDTKGTRAEKQEASGHRSAAMLDIYDAEIKLVKPAGE